MAVLYRCLSIGLSASPTSNHVAARWQGQEVQLHFDKAIGMGKIYNLSYVQCFVIAGAKRGDSRTSETANILVFSRSSVSVDYRW